MDLVSHEAGGLVDEVNTPFEALFEINLVALCDRNSIGDDDHSANLPPLGAKIPPKQLRQHTLAISLGHALRLKR